MRPLAIVLRGPVAVGKTTVGRALLREAGSTVREPVILDVGWAPGERRFNGGSARYEDLRKLPSSGVVVIELGWGEPIGEGFKGATRNPGEWAEVLREDGRELRLFRLRARRREVIDRAEHKLTKPLHRFDTSHVLHWFSRYEKDQDVKSLPSRLGLAEEIIDTTQLTSEQVAKVILGRLQLDSRAPVE